MVKLEAYGSIKDGKLTLANERRYRQDLMQFKDCSVEITIRKKNRRSNPQNRYYHGVVVKEIELRMRELGNDVNPEVVHEFLKDRFLPKKEILGEGGEVVGYKPGSTATLNKDEFALFIDKILQFASEYLGIVIPLPNEKLELMF